MSGATILAVGAVSAFGAGDAAFAVGGTGERARVAIEHDDTLARAGFARPIAARVHEPFSARGDRAALLLRSALDQCLARLGEVRPRWRESRIGLVIGTSSGGMSTVETFLAARARRKIVDVSLARGATYFAPLEAATLAVGLDFSPRVLLLGACASSTFALGLALRWLQLRRVRHRAGRRIRCRFRVRRRRFRSPARHHRDTPATLSPRPRRHGARRGRGRRRDGAGRRNAGGRDDRSSARRRPRQRRGSAGAFSCLVGFGATTDAVHITAPDKTGLGLARAATLALSDAGVAAAAIGVVSAHATATPFNDSAEAKSMKVALGEPGPKVVHPFKAQIGHALGAAGILESLALLDAARRGLAPAAAGAGQLDPECAVPLADVNTPLPAMPSLKLSSAFGGANAALVFAPHPAAPAHVRGRPVFLHAFVTVEAPLDARTLAECLGDRHPNLPRLDGLARLVLSAVHRLSTVTGTPAIEGGGIIVGHALATLETNELFDARRRERGPRSVEPRRFPATSPNAAAGECAIAFRLDRPDASLSEQASTVGWKRWLSHVISLRPETRKRCSSWRPILAAPPRRSCSSRLARRPSRRGPALPSWGPCRASRPLLRPDAECEVDARVPRTLGPESDWIWTGPAGHLELEKYLRTL